MKMKGSHFKLTHFIIVEIFQFESSSNNNSKVKYHVYLYLLLIMKCLKVQFIVIPNVLFFFIKKKGIAFTVIELKGENAQIKKN